MKFNIKRDLVFFDVETTGLNIMTDRIIQIGLIKYTKNQECYYRSSDITLST